MELDKNAYGLTLAIFWGAAVFLGTIFLLLIGSGGATIGHLRNFYLGYSYSYLGALIGLVWAFVTGFIGGWLFAFFYNLFRKKS